MNKKEQNEKIVASRYWLVKMPFKSAITWGSGKRDGTTRLIVELTTSSGIKAYGETICLLDFIPKVLDEVVLKLAMNKSIFAVEDLYQHVLGAGYYHHKRAVVMALAAVEMAMWDAIGKHANLPLYKLWGGAIRDKIAMTAYIFIEDPTKLSKIAKDFYQQGYRSFKVKIGKDPQSDINIVKTIRKAIGPNVHLRADVNGAWTIGTAKRQLAKLAEYDLAYIEQPLEMDDLEGSAHLRNNQSIPIALDESAYTINDVANIIKAKAADVILLDPHEQGGLKPCLKAAAVCEANNIPITLHSGGELGLSQAAYLHLAATCPNMHLAIDTEHSYLQDDIIRDKFKIKNGHLSLPTKPGLGVEVDLAKIKKYQVAKITGAYLDDSKPNWYPKKPAY